MKIKKTLLIEIILFFIFSLISMIIFMHTHILYCASDMQFHMQRIMELKQSIIHNNFLPEFSFSYFHGSSVMGMYPFISVIPFSLILIFTSSLIHGYYYFFALNTFLSLIFSFFSSLNYNKNKFISYIFSITYSLSSVFACKFFTDGDLGVATSLVFMPLVIFGFLKIIRNCNSFIELSLGVTLMCYCQISAVTIVVLFICAWFLLNIFKINLIKFINFIKAGILTILLTSIIWIPILNISFTNRINTVVYKALVGYSMKFLLENVSIIALCTVILGAFYYMKFNTLDKQMYIISIIVLLASSKLMPWHFITSLPVLSLFNQFQFTFRFLIIPQILLCYLFSVIVYKFITLRKFRLKPSMVLLTLMVILFQIGSQGLIINRKMSLVNTHFNNYNDVKEYELNKIPHHGGLFKNNHAVMRFINGYTINTDYYPKASNSKLDNIHNNEGVYKNNKVIHIKRDGYNIFMFHNSKSIKHLVLPLLHYNNEHLHIYLNHHLVHYQTNKNSLITLNNVNNGKNRVKIQYIPNTLLVILKGILFLIGLIWLIYVLIKRHMNNKRLLIGGSR